MKNKLILILFCSIFCNTLLISNTTHVNSYLSDQEFITGEDGVIRMYVNVLGHVNRPGTYLVYDGIDFISLLSLAGGASRGADLTDVKIINDETYIVNFKDYLKNGKINQDVKILPRTTIYIEERMVSKLFRGTNVISSLLQLLNIAITIDRTSN